MDVDALTIIRAASDYTLRELVAQFWQDPVFETEVTLALKTLGPDKVKQMGLLGIAGYFVATS